MEVSMVKYFGFLFFIGAAVAMGPAKATTLDFSDLSGGSCAVIGPSVASQGFTFTAPWVPNPDLTFGFPDGLFLCNGSLLQHNLTPALLSANLRSDLTFSPTAGGTFSLQSFFAGGRTDFLDPSSPPLGYTVATGIKIIGTTGSGTVTESIVFDGLVYSYFSLTPDFIGLTSVEFIALGAGPNPEFLINDIGVNQPAPVEEPPSLAIFGVGLAGVGLIRRRRNA